MAATINKTDLAIDFALIVTVSTLAFAVTYHPYFFGDELIVNTLAITHGYSFWPIFNEINTYKPRLVGNGILALLAKWQLARSVTCGLQIACVVWITALLYGVVRYLFKGDRLLAWLTIATVWTSRYGIAFYYDYSSGLLDLLATALLLTALLAAWLAWRVAFNWRFAIAALVAAVLCVFVHERFVAGLLAAGGAIAVAECIGSSARRRPVVVGWAISLGVLPLVLFWIANTLLGSLPLATGHAGLKIHVGWDILFTIVTYGYNVFLGGNYGHPSYWGTYVQSDPAGMIIGAITVLSTLVLSALIGYAKALSWGNRWLAAGILSSAMAMLVVGSLPGSIFHQPRWMFPVGILLSITWIVLVRDLWRHAVIAVILATNLTYLLLGTHASTAQVLASRSASLLAESLLEQNPKGTNGLLVGSPGGLSTWSIGGCCAVDVGFTPGDAFSKLNLKSELHIDPFIPGRRYDPARYDFALVFDHTGPDLIDRYRSASVADAFAMVGLSAERLSIRDLLGGREIWPMWQWNTPLAFTGGAVTLRPGTIGICSFPAADLNGRVLVYRARATAGTKVPMRLQVNWHPMRSEHLLGINLEVVDVDETWRTFTMLLQAPPEAVRGAVYATLHDGAQGVVELQSVELQ